LFRSPRVADCSQQRHSNTYSACFTPVLVLVSSVTFLQLLLCTLFAPAQTCCAGQSSHRDCSGSLSAFKATGVLGGSSSVWQTLEHTPRHGTESVSLDCGLSAHVKQLHRHFSLSQRCRLGLQRCTSTQALLPRRCCFNAPLQLLTGVPHIEHGLQNAFVVAGRDTRPDIQRLWKSSLARLVVIAIRHVKGVAATDSVGNLEWFVEELGRRFPAMQDVVQWIDKERYMQLESASTTTV